MRVYTELLAFKLCLNVSIGSCRTALFKALILLGTITTYLQTRNIGYHSASTNSEELEGVKMWVSSQVPDFFNGGI
jgi:hypothetical protein